MVKNLPAKHETQVDPWVGKIPWRREWLPTPVSVPIGSHGQRSLVGCSPCGHKQPDKTERLTQHSPYLGLFILKVFCLIKNKHDF